MQGESADVRFASPGAQRLVHCLDNVAPDTELAERLVALLPPGLTRVFYSDTGSTAVEVALKLAHQYWRNLGQAHRRGFITLHHAYHGDTVGAMSVSEESVFTEAFRPLLFEVTRADAPYCYRCPLGLARASCGIDCLGSLEKALKAQPVAAVLIEPMLQGAGGMVVWPSEFLAGVRRLCDRYGTLLIADEVVDVFLPVLYFADSAGRAGCSRPNTEPSHPTSYVYPRP